MELLLISVAIIAAPTPFDSDVWIAPRPGRGKVAVAAGANQVKLGGCDRQYCRPKGKLRRYILLALASKITVTAKHVVRRRGAALKAVA